MIKIKTFKKVYASSYSDEVFFIDRFEMGANAYREDNYGVVERLRVVSILSAHVNSDYDEVVDTWDVDYDYDVIFTKGSTKYCIAFESDGEIDDLPDFLDIIWC